MINRHIQRLTTDYFGVGVGIAIGIDRIQTCRSINVGSQRAFDTDSDTESDPDAGTMIQMCSPWPLLAFGFCPFVLLSGSLCPCASQ